MNGKAAWTVLGLLAAAIAGPAAADDERLYYVGGSVGYSQYKATCKQPPLPVPCDSTDGAWRAFGGYQFNRYFSAEFGYANLGEVTGEGGAAGNFTLETKAFDVSALFAIPVAARLSALFRAGAYRARMTLKQDPAVNTGDTNSGPTFGAGLGTFLGPIGLRTEWQRYVNVGGGATGEDDIDVYTLSLLWRF